MDLRLPEQTTQLVEELTRWATSRPLHEIRAEDDAAAWAQLVRFGLFDLESEGGSLLDVACGVMAAARRPLPGPVVEAELAVAAAGDVARTALVDGVVVTSVPPGPAGPTVVPWGARAGLVVDQADGSVLADGGLPPVSSAYGHPHGWYDRPTTSTADDPLRPRRWLLSAAASAGLAAGALTATVRYATEREQFGRPISSFQAIQMRLAESLHLLERCELIVRDAAWRMGEGRPDGPVSAALAWLFVAPSVKTITGHAHQVYGALGFATETGLFGVTSQAQWLRVAEPSKAAARFITAHRARATGVPPSQVLAGFSQS